jgi:hypothetical protein
VRLMVVLLLLLFSITAEADQFLKKSKILEDNNIKIFVGENQEDAIVLHKEDSLNYNDDVFLLSDDGLYPLKGKMVKRNLLKECGNPIPGIGFNKNGGKGFLIASGEKATKIVRWYPSKIAKKLDNTSCMREFIKTKKTKIHYYQSHGINETIFQIRWRRNLTNDEIQTYCLEMAKWNIVHVREWNPKHREGDTVESFTDECLKKRWYCKFEDYNIVGMTDGQGECRLVTDSVIDCDNKVKKGYNLSEFLGVLKLVDREREETWLLWNAPGYEGEGIYGVEINDIGKEDKSNSEEWLVYNGC